jgi:hypothetical protein
MKVFILCKRYVDSKTKVCTSKIIAVYEDGDEAYTRLEKQSVNNNFSWYIVSKDVKTRAVKNALARL